MAFFVIPIPATIIPFDQQVELDSTLFTLQFRYSRRTGFWSLTLIRSGAVILANVKVVNSLDLLAQYRHLEELPLGTIIVSDQNLAFADPNDTNFGESVLFMYQDAT